MIRIDNADLYTKELHDLMYRAADTIEMLSKKVRESKQEWIPCSERLPEEEGEYLVTQKNGSIGIYVFNYDGNSEEYFKRCATAWMPLPKPYKGADDYERAIEQMEYDMPYCKYCDGGDSKDECDNCVKIHEEIENGNT